MDNHLWVREDSVVDKLISCLECMWSCGWQTLVVQLVTCSLHFAAWWWIAVIDCSGWNVCPGSYYVCTGFWPHHRSLCFDTLLIFLYSNLKSLSQTNRKHMHRHTQVILGACWCICSHTCTRALTQGCQLAKKNKNHVNHQWHHMSNMRTHNADSFFHRILTSFYPSYFSPDTKSMWPGNGLPESTLLI